MAREKKVFTDKNETAHAWAKQEQSEGREGSRITRIFFEGPTIYSYGRHFPIATFHQKKGQEKFVLFTTRKYSPTTEAHKWAARNASSQFSSQFKRIYCYNPEKAVNGQHEENMKDWETRAEVAALKLAKATKPEKYLSEIASLRREMEEYAAYFKCGVKKYKFRYLFIESQEVGKKLTAKEHAARAAAEKVNKEKRAKYEAEQAKREADRVAEEIKDFHEGERDHVRGGEYTFLRFQSGEIQTSKGIKIKCQLAEEYYLKLKIIQSACREEKPHDIRALIGNMRFIGYPMNSVSTDCFEIGCHKIQFSELDAVAKAAGFTMQAMKVEG